MKIHISPFFGEHQARDGGIRRVVDAQRTYLPVHGVEVVGTAAEADLVAVHAGAMPAGVTNEHVLVEHNHGLYWNEYQWDKWDLELNQQVLRVIRESDAVTAPSEWVANSLRRGTWRPVTVIPHGVDSQEWQPPQAGTAEPYVLWNKSRVDAVCDPSAVDRLAEIFPRVQFRTTFSSRGGGASGGNVQVYGPLQHSAMHDMVRYAGLYLCTARETFGIGTLEAMACGVPVIGWAFGGQTDIVQHQAQGWLAPYGDYDSLAAGLKWCFENRARLSEAARLRAMDYSWSNIAEQYAQFYQAALGARPTKRVSIIVTSHNLGEYLPAALDSAIAQVPIGAEPHEMEIIVVDDCSTDDSYATALRYQAEHPDLVKAVKTPTNLRLPGALNYGVERAQGRYILPLDADNMLPPHAAELLADALDSNRGLDVAYGKIKFVLPDGSTPDAAACGQPQGGDGISTWPPEHFTLAEQLRHHNQVPSGAMYRKKVWETVGGYRWRCRNTAEDADFWCRVGSFGALPARVTTAVTMIYRNRPDSMSHVNKDWPWHNWYPWGSGEAGRPYVLPTDLSVNTVSAFAEPKIAVIVPVGPAPDHAGCLLLDALDSVYAQSFKDWECIVVNDSGTDLGWVPSWARVVRTSSHGGEGAGVARNVGLASVSPSVKVWMPLDADDYLEPTALQALYDALIQHGGYAYSDYRRVETFETVPIDDVPTCEAIHDRMLHPITALYPIVPEVRFDPTLRYGEDWDFVLAMHAAGYCGTHVAEPLVYYRRTSGNNRARLLEGLDAIGTQIRNKWRSNMAGCGCGRGGGVKVAPGGASSTQSMNGTAPAAPQEGMELLRYLGEQPSITYSMTPTHTAYKFGADRGRKEKYVLAADVDYFLKRTGEFERA